MDRTDNYLYRAVRGDENSITELLVNLLRRKCFRDVILKSLKMDIQYLDSIDFSNIQTQSRETAVGIPDIVIENDKVKYYIEVKTTTGTRFQDSQLTDYPKKLKASGKESKLIFLVPDKYSHIEEAENLKAEYEGGLIQIVKWSELIKGLVENDLLEDGSIAKEIVSFISETTIKRAPEVILSPMEVAIMYNTRDLVHSASLLFKVQKILAEIAGPLDYQLAREIGSKYVKLDKNLKIKDLQFDEYALGLFLDDGNVFIGFTFNDDIEFRDYVFSIAILKSKFKKPNRIEHFDDKEDENEEYYYLKLKDVYAFVDGKNMDQYIKAVLDTLTPVYSFLNS